MNSRRLSLTIVLAYALAVMIHYDLSRNHTESDSPFSQIVYLPPAAVLKRISFGYNALLADFLYLWSIQYYGDPLFHPRVQFLPRTYELITDLDPYFIDAYETGALFLFYEGRNPKAGLKLLDKGLENNRAEWILPADAGFYCMINLRNNKLSSEYFRKAVKIPDSPLVVKRLLAGTEFRIGDKRTALQLWSDVYQHAENATTKQIAFQHVHDLKVLIDLEELKKAIQNYRGQTGHLPLNLNQLEAAGNISALPVDPEGNAYEYDPQSGNVKYSRQLTLYKRFQ